MALSSKTIEYVAHLSRIRLSDAELELLSRQLKDVLAYIDKLAQVDVSGVGPASYSMPSTDALRDDTVRPSLSADQALGNAPAREGDFFVVPKIIE